MVLRRSSSLPGGFIQREVILLVVAAVAAVPLFLFTRAAAEWNRQSHLRAAAQWFDRGNQQLQRNEVAPALESFHAAVVNDHDNGGYALGLATALIRAGRDIEARQILARLRETAPEDPEINLQLARLASRQASYGDALRYYHNSIYGIWQAGAPPEGRLGAREEVVRLLLANGKKGEALSELMALGAEIPPDSQWQLRTGILFQQAGDSKSALQFFSRVLQRDRANSAALTGAAEAAFHLGLYEESLRYSDLALRQDSHLLPAQQWRAEASQVLAIDPLAMHLAASERQQRLKAGLEQARERLANCRVDSGESLANEASNMLAATGRGDAEAGLELIVRIEDAAARACGPPAGLDRALLLAGRRHQMPGQGQVGQH